MVRRLNRILASFVFAGLSWSGLSYADAPATQPTTQTKAKANYSREAADEPAPKHGRNGDIDGHFKALHEEFLKRGKDGKIGVLFIGDSITEGWKSSKERQAIFDKAYGSYDPANFGIGGDMTQHVLWRFENGEIDGIHPKVVVLMIGTNNTGGYTVEQITAADEKIVAEIHQKLPDTKLLLLGIFPRGMDPKDAYTAALRDKIKQVNAELAKLDDGVKTRYLDIGDKFLVADGILPKEIMPDALHPNEKGYQIWADAMQPLLDEMMK